MVPPLYSPLPLLPPFSRGELGREGNRRSVIHGNGGKQRTRWFLETDRRPQKRIPRNYENSLRVVLINIFSVVFGYWRADFAFFPLS